MLDKVLITRSATLNAYAATMLCAVLGKRCTLDVTHMRNGNNHIFIGIEVFRIELFRRVNNLGTTLIAILLLHLLQLILYNLQLHIDAGQDIVEVGNLALQLGTLILQLLDLQARQLTQTHLGNRSSLNLAKTKTLLQSLLCQIVITRVSDDMYYFVDIILCNDKALHNMHTLLRLLQIKASTTYDNIVTMLDEILNQILKIKQHRTAIHKRDIIYGKRRLQLRILKERIQHNIGRCITLNFDGDTSTLAVTLIVDM